MIDLSLFTYKEAIELIIGFYTFTCGYWKVELEQVPEAKRFAEMGFTKKDEEYDDLYVLSEVGESLLHEYIKSISEKFIKYIQSKGDKLSYTETSKWFKEEFGLKTDDDGQDIAEYICDNLYNYGYKATRYRSSQKIEFYKLK